MRDCFARHLLAFFDWALFILILRKQMRGFTKSEKPCFRAKMYSILAWILGFLLILTIRYVRNVSCWYWRTYNYGVIKWRRPFTEEMAKLSDFYEYLGTYRAYVRFDLESQPTIGGLLTQVVMLELYYSVLCL